MVYTLLICTYITFLCWTWGSGLVLVFKKMLRYPAPKSFHFSVICLLGFAIITIVAGYLSLFMPLGGWIPQIIFLLPAIFFIGFQKNTILSHTEPLLKNTNVFHFILLMVSIIMILTISSWKIVHPDTLSYHEQTIKWIEKYKAVPGLVHLYTRYGYQGLWFVSAALFRFSFTGLHATTFINTAITTWFIIFLADNLNKSWNKRSAQVFTWIALFIISLACYTQVRLTVASASPDFIAVLVVWLCFYLLVAAGKDQLTILIIFLLSLVSITIKLSAVPVILVAVTCISFFISLKKWRPVVAGLLLLVIIFIPFFARNIISTGYAVFPVAASGFVNPDWKFDEANTRLEKNYISAYARIPVEHTDAEIKKVLEMSWQDWVPKWWKAKSFADRCVLVLALLSILIFLVFPVRFINLSREAKIVLLISLAGLLFWFLQAPDPRFGFAFILVPPGLAFSYLPGGKIIKRSWIYLITLYLLIISISVYTGYRYTHFFSFSQFMKPEGIKTLPYHTSDCSTLILNIPDSAEGCGDTELPCVYNKCTEFVPRGKTPEDGFRSAKQNP